MNKISIIIPCFNEERYITEVFRRIFNVVLPGIQMEIILVNDGSTDQTESVLKNYLKESLTQKIKKRISVRVIRHPKNLGKGAALRTGLGKAKGDVVIIQDADAEYNPSQYALLLGPFTKQNAKAVYGSRTLGIKKYNNKYAGIHYYLGGRLLSHIVNLLFGLSLTDQPTGYKLFRKDMVAVLLQNMTMNDFSAEIEMTAALAKKGIPIIEIPITYTPRSPLDGKKIKFSDFIKSVYVSILQRMA